MLSHELRNPLAPIANAASVLRTLESTNPILFRLREILERQVARMGLLIEELIDVTRAAQGQITLVREQVSVESVVQAAVAASHDKLTGRGHRLDVDVPRRAPFRSRRRGRLAQALSHLIINAAKFSFEPSTDLDQRPARRQDGPHLGQGPGRRNRPEVPAARLRAVRAAGPDARAHARWARRRPDARPPHRPAARRRRRGLQRRAGPGQRVRLLVAPYEPEAAVDDLEGGVPRLSESYRVLIVEDNADTLESLRLQMELWGTEVSTARNAEEALDVAGHFRPQIVCATSACPGWTALRLVEPLRDKLKGMPVVFAAVHRLCER
jgi:hypothetical protein